jgi:hypothetical protein
MEKTDDRQGEKKKKGEIAKVMNDWHVLHTHSWGLKEKQFKKNWKLTPKKSLTTKTTTTTTKPGTYEIKDKSKDRQEKKHENIRSMQADRPENRWTEISIMQEREDVMRAEVAKTRGGCSKWSDHGAPG